MGISVTRSQQVDIDMEPYSHHNIHPLEASGESLDHKDHKGGFAV